VRGSRQVPITAGEGLACLLDLDPDVVRWSAAPPLLRDDDGEFQVDFFVLTADPT
jgi:hypothetical protein